MPLLQCGLHHGETQHGRIPEGRYAPGVYVDLGEQPCLDVRVYFSAAALTGARIVNF